MKCNLTRLLAALVCSSTILLLNGCAEESRLNTISDSIALENYERYLAVRGPNLISAVEKLEQYGLLAYPNPVLEYTFEVDAVGDWTVFRFPGGESHWMFHNIVYWFLGYGPDDPNYADEVVGIAMAPASGSSYILYGDNSKSRPIDALYGLFQDGDRFLVNVPFDEYSDGDDGPWNEVLKELNLVGIADPMQRVSLPGAKTVLIPFYHPLDQLPGEP